jgi:ribonuclease J
MVKLRFYGGVNEIGGNKILLEDGKTRIFLDFGKSFAFGTDYFTGWLEPRTVN